MIRQAHTYLAGAMGGATLIAIAIAVFVLLVSAQVFRDWPLAAFGDDDGASVSESRVAPGAGPDEVATTTAAAAGPAAARGADGSGAPKGDGAAAGSEVESRSVAANGGDVGATGTPAVTQPGGSGGSGDQGGSAAGGEQGSAAAPAGSAQPSSPSSQGTATGSAGSGGSTGGGGGGTKTAGGGGGETAAPTTSGQVTETVNSTVDQVDQTVTGGALEATGVTGVTEEAVNGVAGPESTVGKVVDGTVDAVGNLLGGKR